MVERSKDLQAKTREDRAKFYRQLAGVERHVKVKGRGWFYRDPNTVKDAKKSRYGITEVFDYSGRPTSIYNPDQDTYTEVAYPEGSFKIEIGSGSSFIISHPEDRREFLAKAGVPSPQELIGKQITLFWEGQHNKIAVGNRILGVQF